MLLGVLLCVCDFGRQIHILTLANVLHNCIGDVPKPAGPYARGERDRQRARKKKTAVSQFFLMAKKLLMLAVTLPRLPTANHGLRLCKIGFNYAFNVPMISVPLSYLNLHAHECIGILVELHAAHSRGPFICMSASSMARQ